MITLTSFKLSLVTLFLSYIIIRLLKIKMIKEDKRRLMFIFLVVVVNLGVMDYTLFMMIIFGVSIGCELFIPLRSNE